jgi:hypothetical protein
VDRLNLEDLGEQSESKVLPSDVNRQETTDKRTLKVVAAFGRDIRSVAPGREMTREREVAGEFLAA